VAASLNPEAGCSVSRNEAYVAAQRTGGFTIVARELTAARRRLVTRQGVYMWWRRRDHNQFPDRFPVTTKRGSVKFVFDVESVIAWYDWYMSLSWQGRRELLETTLTPAPSDIVKTENEEGMTGEQGR
jgi:hypothetical protein